MPMFSAEYKRDFDRDGFVVVRQFLAGRDLAELTAQLDRYIEQVVPALPSSAAFFDDPSRPETLKQMQHMGQDPYFEQYRRQPRWQALADLLLGEPAAAQQPEWFNKPPGTDHPTPPHQDNYYFCLRPPSVATLWVALDAADAENGGLRYVQGSYHDGIRPHNPSQVLGFSQGITDYGPQDEDREVLMCLEPGDLIAHHGETIHRADPNRSTRQRRAFAMVFYGASARRDEAAYARYMAAVNTQHKSLGLEVE